MCEQIWNWKNLPIILTDHALDKSYDIGLSMYDIEQLLEYSDDCLEDKREKKIFERCTKWRGNDIKIVFKKDYTKWLDSNCWLIITIIERG